MVEEQWCKPIGRLAWDRRRRLEFIEFLLYWERIVTPRQLAEYFGISEERGRQDLAEYGSLTARRLPGGERRSNLAEKDRRGPAGYWAASPFSCRFIEPRFDDYANFYAGAGRMVWTSSPSPPGYSRTEVRATQLPRLRRRNIDLESARRLVHAILSKRDLCLHYLSPRYDDPRRILVAPSFLANDGFRWHLRAYFTREDGSDGKFGDLVLDRIAGVEEREIQPLSPPADPDNRIVNLEIVANPKLAPHEQANIAAQYDEMADGVWRLSLKASLVPYFLKLYHLEEDSIRKAPNQAPLSLRNRKTVTQYISKGWRVPPDRDSDPIDELMAGLRRQAKYAGVSDLDLVCQGLKALAGDTRGRQAK